MRCNRPSEVVKFTFLFYIPRDRVAVQYMDCDKTWDLYARRRQVYHHTCQEHKSYKKYVRIRSHCWRKPVTQDSSCLVRLAETVCKLKTEAPPISIKCRIRTQDTRTKAGRSTTESLRVLLFQVHVQHCEQTASMAKWPCTYLGQVLLLLSRIAT